MNVKVKKLHPSALLPDRAHPTDAGADLFSLEAVEIPPQSAVKARTGLSIALPEGTAGIVWGKSSLESQGLIVTAGLVDEGYRGEVLVCLFNLTNEPKNLAKGQKMAQLLVMPVRYVNFDAAEELEASRRGTGGFGSTGKHKGV
ncbi:MAG: dUTP diphosphatase [Elusimicrobia bacterium]|nr:dUTP diphosphatase [Elusimicrobiota bacterium]